MVAEEWIEVGIQYCGVDVLAIDDDMRPGLLDGEVVIEESRD